MNLTNDVKVIPFGIETALDQSILRILAQKYDGASLFLRTRPDFFVIGIDEVFLVEAKQHTQNLEAIQLLYNKQYDRMGVRVVYSFPDFAINASMIPIDQVIIPKNYKQEFDKNLKHLFEIEGIKKFTYIGHVVEGSGDAFVPVEPEELLILAEGTTP